MKLNVKVKARAKGNRVAEAGPGSYKVWVKAVPEKGKANEAVIAVLSEYLKVPKSRMVISVGQTSNQKIITVSE